MTTCDRTNPIRPAAVLLFAAIASTVVPGAALSAPAARVEFAIGNAQVISPNGQSRLAQKGVEVGSGETVSTNEGRVQLRFTDGAFVSLQPRSDFRVDEYRYEGKADGSEKGFFSLLKGGLRTITGLVGRTNKKNYQVTTSVATIGIRGTEYTLSLGNSITGSVGEGGIDVCNAGGCLAVSSGEGFYVSNPDVKGVITTKKTDLPPTQPYTPPVDFTAGDTTSNTGNPVGLLLTGNQSLSLAVPGFTAALPTTPVTLGTNGAVTSINAGGSLITFPSGLEQFGNDGIVAWGRGFGQDANGGTPYLHYVTGIPTPDIGSLKMVATYTLAGGTSPTAHASPGESPFAIGNLVGGSLTANFGTGQVGTYVNLNVAGVNLVLQGQNMGINGNTFSGGTPTCSDGSGTCAVTGMSGFFAGTNASRAALAYQLQTAAIPVPASTPCKTCEVAQNLNVTAAPDIAVVQRPATVQGVATFTRN